MISVSVVIPTYNHAHFVRDAIDSVLAQTRPALEVIVVDDGSTDGTEQVLESYGTRIRSIIQPNAGVAAARNAGLRVARGDLVAFLDSDDMWLPRKLEKQVPLFERDASLGMAHCGAVDIDREGRELQTHLDGMEGRVSEHMLLFRRAVVLLGGSTALVPRSVLDVVGDFDTRLPPAEDWDLWYRIGSRFPIGFVPEVLVRYRLHGANSHLNVKRMERALMIGFSKAFHNAEPEVARIKRRAYGNLHMVLAGSYFSVRQLRPFARHALRSVWLTPDNLGYLLKFPLRRLSKMRNRAQKPRA